MPFLSPNQHHQGTEDNFTLIDVRCLRCIWEYVNSNVLGGVLMESMLALHVHMLEKAKTAIF